MKTLVSAIGAVVFTVALSAGGFGAASQSTQSPPKAPSGQSQSGQGRSSDRSSRPWWKVPEVMKEVGITPEQSKKIDDLFHKRWPDATAREGEFKKQNAILNKLMAERTVGADVIGVQVDRVEASRTTLNKTRTIMIYEMYMILSPEQYTKLVAYQERQRGRGDSRNK